MNKECDLDSHSDQCQCRLNRLRRDLFEKKDGCLFPQNNSGNRASAGGRPLSSAPRYFRNRGSLVSLWHCLAARSPPRARSTNSAIVTSPNWDDNSRLIEARQRRETNSLTVHLATAAGNPPCRRAALISSFALKLPEDSSPPSLVHCPPVGSPAGTRGRLGSYLACRGRAS